MEGARRHAENCIIDCPAWIRAQIAAHRRFHALCNPDIIRLNSLNKGESSASLTVPFFDLHRQYARLKAEIDQAVAQVIESGHFVLGPRVSQFEKQMSSYLGVHEAIGVASGTDALLLALRACNVKPGDEVITTPFTFVATIETIIMAGATPVFADIEPISMNISPEQIAKKITNKTKAIIPVHLFGYAADMPKILELAKAHDIKVVEDAAQGIGSGLSGKKAGSFGDAGCLSFFPTKNLGAFGDGGMVTTSDPAIAEEVRILRGHGSRRTYYYDEIGMNSRLDEIQAAILSVKFAHLSELTRQRQSRAALYAKTLADLPVQLPSAPKNGDHTYHQYTIRSPHRDAIRTSLAARGIGSMIYYPLSLHLQKAYAYLGHHPGDFPESEKAQNEVLSLPIFPELTDAEVFEVAAALRTILLQEQPWKNGASVPVS